MERLTPLSKYMLHTTRNLQFHFSASRALLLPPCTRCHVNRANATCKKMGPSKRPYQCSSSRAECRASLRTEKELLEYVNKIIRVSEKINHAPLQDRTNLYHVL